jgi:HD-GYP domain-containing protein (c-di-GMP phosphodiesterase class II)
MKKYFTAEFEIISRFVSKRLYKETRSHEDALGIVVSSYDSQFDLNIAEVFIRFTATEL